MSKHLALEFHKKLDNLFKLRTSWLRRAVDKGIKTKPKILDAKRRREGINELQRIATECLCSEMSKNEFAATVQKKKQWHCTRNKGWSRTQKRKHFDQWFQKYIPFKNCIYIFWKGRKAIYVGRTIKGKGRPQSHFSKFWFNGITRIDIFSTSQASQVPKLECLAIHNFEPQQNGQKASIPKWAKKCPVCEVRHLIETELRDIFSFK